MSFEVASDSGSDGDEDPPGGDGDESGDDDGDSDGNGEDDGMRHTDVACDPETNHFNRQRVLPDDYVTASPESEQESPNPPDVERACRKRNGAGPSQYAVQAVRICKPDVVQRRGVYPGKWLNPER